MFWFGEYPYHCTVCSVSLSFLISVTISVGTDWFCATGLLSSGLNGNGRSVGISALASVAGLSCIPGGLFAWSVLFVVSVSSYSFIKVLSGLLKTL